MRSVGKVLEKQTQVYGYHPQNEEYGDLFDSAKVGHGPHQA